MYCRSRYEVSSPMSGRKRKLRLTRKAFLYRETGGPPSFQAKKKFYGDDLVFPRGIMRSQRRQLDRALSFFTTDPGKYLTLGNIMILRLSSVFPLLHCYTQSQQFLICLFLYQRLSRCNRHDKKLCNCYVLRLVVF